MLPSMEKIVEVLAGLRDEDGAGGNFSAFIHRGLPRISHDGLCTMTNRRALGKPLLHAAMHQKKKFSWFRFPVSFGYTKENGDQAPQGDRESDGLLHQNLFS